MKLIIDGKNLKNPIKNDAKIIWEEVTVTIEDQELEGQLHLTTTSEGIILDFFETGSEESIITQSMTLEEVINLMQN